MPHNINVHGHPVKMGNNPNQNKRWTDFIKESINGIIIDTELTEIDFYNFDGKIQRLIGANASGKRLVVLGNAAFRQDGDPQGVVEGVQIGTTHYNVIKPSGLGTPIYTVGVNVVAEFIQESCELNIMFDLFADFTDERTAILKDIFTCLNEIIFKAKASRFSWKHTSDKPSLMRNLITSVRQAKEAQLEGDKRQCAEWEHSIESYRSELKKTYDKLFQRRNAIVHEESLLGDIEKAVVTDLDMVANSDRVVDLVIKDGKYTVYTTTIYATDELGRRYYIGNCWIEINMQNASVKFFSDNKRNGFWSGGNNNHPHVKQDGTACLGNAQATIAELCSQQQFYALVMVCINYLEAVNIKDAAGARVTAWDMVDADGKVIKKGGTYRLDDSDRYEDCDRCDESVATRHEVFNVVHITADESGDLSYEVDESRMVCEDCRDNHYTFHSEAREYIRNGGAE